MCTAAVAPFSNRPAASSATAHAETRSTRSNTARFAMKLPRCNSAFAARASSARARQEAEGATPRVKNGAAVARTGSAASNSRDSGMRRSQSNHPSRLRSCGIRESRSQRSRSQGRSSPASTSNGNGPTRVVPVPECARRRRAELARSADRSDLARMYDYATWNMYERIVSARRQRLQSQPNPSNRATRANGQTSGSATKAGSGTASRLAKASSHGDESTTETADDTDRSSAASSLWSRENSPMPFPGQAHPFRGVQGGDSGLAFQHLDPRGEGVHSCPPPTRNSDLNEEDSFIFQLDM